jgi:hypothetical protein
MSSLEEVLYAIQSFLSGKNLMKEMNLEQFNYYLSMANDELYRQKIGYPDEIKGFETKNQISEVMERYIYPDTSISLTTGTGSCPAGYNRKISLYYIDASSDKIPIEFVTNEEFDERKNHPNKQPTTTNPIAIIRGTTPSIYVLPSSISTVYLTYIKKPTTPILGLKLENGIMVYNSISSTELDWDTEYYNDIIRIILKYIGIPENELSNLVSYSMSEQNQKN